MTHRLSSDQFIGPPATRFESIPSVTALVAHHAEKSGAKVYRSRSNQSEARYVRIFHPDNELPEHHNSSEVRIAAHYREHWYSPERKHDVWGVVPPTDLRSRSFPQKHWTQGVIDALEQNDLTPHRGLLELHQAHLGSP